MKVGDLVKLHPEEAALLPVWQRELPGLVLSVDDSTEPASCVVLWNGNREPEEEYSDGLVLVGGD